MADETLRDLADLLAAFGVPDVAGLGVVLSEDADPDIWVDVQPSGSITLVCGTVGLDLTFPTTVAQVWSTVAELEAEDGWSASVEWIGELIQAQEGFCVEVEGPEDQPDGWPQLEHADAYPFRVPAPGDWTVAHWQRARLAVAYPGLQATVLRRDGSPAASHDRLSELREPEAESPGQAATRPL